MVFPSLIQRFWAIFCQAACLISYFLKFLSCVLKKQGYDFTDSLYFSLSLKGAIFNTNIYSKRWKDPP